MVSKVGSVDDIEGHRQSSASRAQNLLNNEAGTQGWRENEHIFIVVQVKKCLKEGKGRGNREATYVSTLYK